MYNRQYKDGDKIKMIAKKSNAFNNRKTRITKIGTVKTKSWDLHGRKMNTTTVWVKGHSVDTALFSNSCPV